ncbi:hypothetical protein CXF70_10325 [Planomicrobium sp. MB-3u-38]|nr:hypothetical protein CXF70_10325 [Planomicrobium sp. MB-3u-38]
MHVKCKTYANYEMETHFFGWKSKRFDNQRMDTHGEKSSKIPTKAVKAVSREEQFERENELLRLENAYLKN